MRAMRLHAYGEPSVIRLDEIDTPAPGPGEVLVEVAGTSFNPSEVGLRRGLLRSIVDVVLPYTLGWDLAGTVTATGRDVRGPAVGDRVIGRLDGGAAAELVVAPANVLVPAPANVPLADAAALPIAGVTAWQAVHEHARVRDGQRVLINGVGAIGRYAIQLARLAGAHVIALASPRSEKAAHEAGAHEVNPPDTAPVDVIIHLAPAEPPAAALLRPGGVLVSATIPAGVHFIVRNDTADLGELVKMVDAGRLRVDVAARRPLTDLPDVHREAEDGRLRPGKTVLLPTR